MGKRYKKLALLGVGLLGASFASAMRETGNVETLYGYGRTEANLIYAKNQGIIDHYSLSASEVCHGADLIVLALPVGGFIETIKQIAPVLKKGALITDTGSIKGSLVYGIEEILPNDVNYVGSHPIAGSHQSGVKHSDKGLFQEALCIITPTEKSHPEAVRDISDLWISVGCRVTYLDPFEHDEIYGLVSHLPHLLAYCLVNTVRVTKEDALSYVGKGFKDMTRIAASAPELWTDIVTMNRSNVREYIDRITDNLSLLKQWLQESNRTNLEEYFKQACEVRRRLG